MATSNRGCKVGLGRDASSGDVLSKIPATAADGSFLGVLHAAAGAGALACASSPVVVGCPS
jgi:hypothetical protein